MLDGANRVCELRHERSHSDKPAARIRSFSVFKKSKNIPEIAGGFVALAESLGWKASRSVDAIGSSLRSDSGKYMTISRPNPDRVDEYSPETISIPVRISDHARTTEMDDFYEENAINLVPSDVFTQSGFAYDTFESALWKLKNASMDEDGRLFFGDEEAVRFSLKQPQAITSERLHGELLTAETEDVARAEQIILQEMAEQAADMHMEENMNTTEESSEYAGLLASFRETERIYGGREAWQRARDADRTELNWTMSSGSRRGCRSSRQVLGIGKACVTSLPCARR